MGTSAIQVNRSGVGRHPGSVGASRKARRILGRRSANGWICREKKSKCERQKRVTDFKGRRTAARRPRVTRWLPLQRQGSGSYLGLLRSVHREGRGAPVRQRLRRRQLPRRPGPPSRRNKVRSEGKGRLETFEARTLQKAVLSGQAPPTNLRSSVRLSRWKAAHGVASLRPLDGGPSPQPLRQPNLLTTPTYFKHTSSFDSKHNFSGNLLRGGPTSLVTPRRSPCKTRSEMHVPAPPLDQLAQLLGRLRTELK
ncbi:UNVERIFIED_CONTAM: hypothetical protein HHA_454680 [Hammondia hammondi]|eukprot:XP_008888293.1 hypothetical protein HHA_454680 [Hammondia hammondi]